MKQIVALLILILLHNSQIVAQQEIHTINTNNLVVKPLSSEDSLKLKIETLLRNVTPIMGYRFVVMGDFEGSHIVDTLYERYTDSTFQHEAPKYYESADTNFDYGDVIFLNEYLAKASFIEWKKLNIQLSGGQLGFHYLENCGDINLDGKDELLVVKQWADFSNINHAYIYTIENMQWKEIFSIPIWEWQFPETPSASMIPGLFGNFQYGITQIKKTFIFHKEKVPSKASAEVVAGAVFVLYGRRPHIILISVLHIHLAHIVIADHPVINAGDRRTGKIRFIIHTGEVISYRKRQLARLQIHLGLE